VRLTPHIRSYLATNYVVGRRPVRTLQQFIVPVEGFPSRYEEEANFRSLLNTMENIPYPPETS